MTIAEAIIQHVKGLPESAQTEVLNFVEYIEDKTQKTRDRAIDQFDWSALSISQAMRDMESEASPYSSEDFKEVFA